MSNLQGFITFNPPKGSCFEVITTHRSEGYYGCETFHVPFNLFDIDKESKVKWQIFTDDKDMGTEIEWNTNYGIGKIVTFDMPWPGDSRIILVENCQVDPNKSNPRRIKVSIPGEDNPWIISFPAYDYLLKQPPKSPNLYLQSPSIKKSFIKSETAQVMQNAVIEDKNSSKSAQEETIDEINTDPEQRGRIDHLPDNKFNEMFDKFSKNKKEKKRALEWQLPRKDCFTMNGSHFIARTSSTPGMLGRCHYVYKASKFNKNGGTIECQDVDTFKWIMLPLTCLEKIQVSEDKIKKIDIE